MKMYLKQLVYGNDMKNLFVNVVDFVMKSIVNLILF